MNVHVFSHQWGKHAPSSIIIMALVFPLCAQLYVRVLSMVMSAKSFRSSLGYHHDWMEEIGGQCMQMLLRMFSISKILSGAILNFS